MRKLSALCTYMAHIASSVLKCSRDHLKVFLCYKIRVFLPSKLCMCWIGNLGAVYGTALFLSSLEVTLCCNVERNLEVSELLSK